ncbi:hypothetical protein J4N45_11690 [Vibrio sp. SCSIO 43140]|uniref:hypothetical protein n=1 Tax=Vibrio sp. SCSIO 43140 TaxID=2819100 RepID=UPI002075AC77|nr:hypothetical protein [Vibrio sp. SCSIO 43140]USD59190.1 hypothetical protein J4N45_11690 [Vibrio sp. SCSIO 43140]
MKLIILSCVSALILMSGTTFASQSGGRLGYVVDCNINGTVTRMPMTACRQKGGEAK